MATTQQTGLHRTVSTPMLALYGIGNIVGAGVYVLIGKIAEPAGYLSVLAFLIAALVAFCAALSYAELAARFPVSAGISVYLHEAFRAPRLSAIVGILLIVAGVVSTAALLKGFAGYFHAVVPLHPILIMFLLMAILLAITLKGIKESVGTAALLTLVEIGGLLFLMGSILLTHPDALINFGMHFAVSAQTIDSAALAGILSASFIAFYAFIGFEDMVNIAEEVKAPQKAFPRAILAAILLVTFLYIAVAAVALGVMTPAALGESSAPLAAAYTTATGQTAGVIVVIGLLAALNGIIVNIVMGSRFLYGLAHKGWIVAWFAKVSKARVPARGLVVVAIVALLGSLLLPIEHLAQIASALLLFVFFAVNVSLILIRRRDEAESRKLRISPHFMPWLGACASGVLLIVQIVGFVLVWHG